MTKKELIKSLLKKYNKKCINVVAKIDDVVAGSSSSGDIKIKFDITDDCLLIEDVVTKDNVSLYYEFMSAGYIRENCLDTVAGLILDRQEVITEKLLLNGNMHFWKTKNIKNTIGYASPISQSFFGTKDTLKPIDEYIEEIKASDEYKGYYAKSYAKNKVSDCCKSKVNISGINRYICGNCLNEIYKWQVIDSNNIEIEDDFDSK